MLNGNCKIVLLTCVPYLQAHDRVGVGIYHALGHEARADCRCVLRRVEGALAVSRHQRGLADALAAQNHDFCLERGHVARENRSRWCGFGVVVLDGPRSKRGVVGVRNVRGQTGLIADILCCRVG